MLHLLVMYSVRQHSYQPALGDIWAIVLGAHMSMTILLASMLHEAGDCPWYPDKRAIGVCRFARRASDELC